MVKRHSRKRSGMKHKTRRGGMKHKTRRGGMKHKARRGGMKHKTRRGGMKHRRHMMRGGLRPLNPADVNAPAFVPKGVPVVAPGGGANTGIANGSKYYNLAKPSLNTHIDTIKPSHPVQNGGGIIPQPLVQLGRGLIYNLENLYNTSQGAQTYISDNPDVLKQRMSTNNNFDITPINVDEVISSSRTKVANFKPYGV